MSDIWSGETEEGSVHAQSVGLAFSVLAFFPNGRFRGRNANGLFGD